MLVFPDLSKISNEIRMEIDMNLRAITSRLDTIIELLEEQNERAGQ